MRKHYLLIWLLFTQTNLFSQLSDYQLLEKYGARQRDELKIKEFNQNHSTNVNAYNGTFNFSVPLTSIGNEENIISFSLDYSSGIKVTDLSGLVGMGWNLSSIGSISREVRGIPDFSNLNSISYMPGGTATLGLGILKNNDIPNLPIGMFSSGSVPYGCPILTYENASAAVAQTVDEMFNTQTKIDTERDLFTLKLPGVNCQFYFNHNNSINFIQGTKFAIIQKPNDEIPNFSGSAEWIIQTADGTKFYLGSSADAINYSRTFFDGKGIEHITQWHLNKIEYLNGNVIEIIYEKIELGSHNLGSNFEEMNSIGGSIVNGTSYEGQISNAIFNYRGPSLSKNERSIIKSVRFLLNNIPIEKIDLNYENNNPAPGRDYPKQLVSIQKKNISNSQDILVSTIEITYSVNSRRWLEEIKFISSAGVSRNPYVFHYFNKDFFPNIYSLSRDKFNYFNGQNNSHLFPTFNNGSNLTVNYWQLSYPCNREIGVSEQQFGNLNQIITPTGAEINIEYESNRDNTTILPGIRVKSIEMCDSDLDTECVKSHYRYTETLDLTSGSTGRLMRTPIFQNNYGTVSFATNNVGGGSNLVQGGTSFSASPINGYSYSAQGKEVGYSKVWIIKGDNAEGGVTEVNFENKVDALPIAQTTGCTTSIWGQVLTPSHLVPISTNELCNGNILSQIDYKKNGDQFTPVRVTTNTYRYKNSETTGSILTNFGWANTPGLGCATTGVSEAWANCVYYTQRFVSSMLSESDVTFLDENSHSLTTKTKLSYNLFGQPTGSESFLNDESQIRENFFYNTQIENTSLLERKSISRKNHIINERKYIYNLQGQLIEEYRYNRDLPTNNAFELVKEIEYQGSNISYINNLGSKSAYAYEGDLKTAEVGNCKIENCILEGFNSEISTPNYAGIGGFNSASNEEETIIFQINHPLSTSEYTLSFFSFCSPSGQSTPEIVEPSGDDQASSKLKYFYIDNLTGATILTDIVGVIPNSDDWKLNVYTIPKAPNDQCKLVIELISHPDFNLGFDELRIAPSIAIITTYQYNLKGQLISKIDNNLRIERYEYDDLDNLKLVRDFENNIITRTEINYKTEE